MQQSPHRLTAAVERRDKTQGLFPVGPRPVGLGAQAEVAHRDPLTASSGQTWLLAHQDAQARGTR